jgi:DNA polymerase-3 subunit epsilon
MISTILLVDTETTGLLPSEGAVMIEAAAILWSVRHSCILSCWSDLAANPTNEAEAINHIPAAALEGARPRERLVATVQAMASKADIVIAHRAEFDRQFLGDLGKPWVCSKFDIAWPESKLGDGLVFVAIAHGVPVTGAHRALTDCLLLARLFERVAERGHDMQAMFARAMRPKATFRALVSYDDRQLAKDAGFQWDGAAKTWTRTMAIEDAEALGFRTERVSP